MGIYNFIGIFGAQKTSNEFDLAVAATVGAVVALYLGQFGKVAYWWGGEIVPITSLWGYFGLYMICSLSAGASAAATIGYSLWIRDALQSENNEQAQESASRNAGWAGSTHDDSRFDYDASAFGGSARGSASREDPPRGYTDRHPDDAQLWAYVDDPAASDQERRTALDKILKKQARRKGQAGREVARQST